jgi:hypothetical protein
MHAATTTTWKTQIKTKGKMVIFYFNGEEKWKKYLEQYNEATLSQNTKKIRTQNSNVACKKKNPKKQTKNPFSQQKNKI